MPIEKLHGRTSGNTRADLLEFANQAAKMYFAAAPAKSYMHITLSNVETLTVSDASCGDPNARGITGFEGDFTAEVLLP